MYEELATLVSKTEADATKFSQTIARERRKLRAAKASASDPAERARFEETESKLKEIVQRDADRQRKFEELIVLLQNARKETIEFFQETISDIARENLE